MNNNKNHCSFTSELPALNVNCSNSVSYLCVICNKYYCTDHVCAHIKPFVESSKVAATTTNNNNNNDDNNNNSLASESEMALLIRLRALTTEAKSIMAELQKREQSDATRRAILESADAMKHEQELKKHRQQSKPAVNSRAKTPEQLAAQQKALRDAMAIFAEQAKLGNLQAYAKQHKINTVATTTTKTTKV